MAGNSKATAGQTADLLADSVTTTVLRGTVVTDEGKKGPGESVTLPRAQFRQLVDAGILVDPDAAPPDEVQNGQPSVQTTEGPNVSVQQ